MTINTLQTDFKARVQLFLEDCKFNDLNIIITKTRTNDTIYPKQRIGLGFKFSFINKKGKKYTPKKSELFEDIYNIANKYNIIMRDKNYLENK